MSGLLEHKLPFTGGSKRSCLRARPGLSHATSTWGVDCSTVKHMPCPPPLRPLWSSTFTCVIVHGSRW